jgi:hypothetical protein
MLKDIFGRSNQVFFMPSRRKILLTTIIVDMVGSEEMKNIYKGFKGSCMSCSPMVLRFYIKICGDQHVDDPMYFLLLLVVL